MFNHRYGRIKKRTFVVLAICLIAIILPVFILFALTTKDVETNNIADFSVNERTSRQVVQGLGFNIASQDDGNFIKNNSFEPLVYKQNFTIDSGDSETIKILMPNDPRAGFYEDDFFIGAKAEVMSNDQEGNLAVKKTGVVSKYLSDQIDEFQSVKLPHDIPEDIRWNSLAELGQKVVLGGSKGYVLGIDSFSETHLSKLPTEEAVVGICIFNDSFLALDKKGSFYKSDDAITWSLAFNVNEKFDLTKKDQTEETINWVDLKSRVDEQGNFIFMAVGEEGYIVYGQIEKYLLHHLDTEENINSVTANSDGFYLVGDNSLAFYSENGENYRYLDVPIKANWQTVSSRGNQILIAGDQAEIVFSDDGYKFKDLSNELITDISIRYTEQNNVENRETIIINPEFVASSILSNEQLMILDSRGLLYFSDDLGTSWSSMGNPDEIKYNLIQRLPSGRLIATRFNGSVEYALMGLVVKLDSKLEQGEYVNGDSLRLEQLSVKPIVKPIIDQNKNTAGDWFVTDKKTTSIQFDEHSPGGGQTSLEINVGDSVKKDKILYGLYSGQEIDSDHEAPDVFVIKQELDEHAREIIKDNTIFNYEFWAKTIDDDPVELSLSLSGLNTPVEQMGKEIRGDWQKYQGLFIIPKNSVRDDKPLWLELKFKGAGKVYLDNVWMGSSDDLNKDLKSGFSNEIAGGSIIRLDFLAIGNVAFPSESWHTSTKNNNFYYQDDNKLEIVSQANLVSSMELCHSFNANPWLVIDSQASDLELRHLMQYLFGQQNTPYGELRNSQGALGRYSDTFSQIYFEVNDTNGLLENDWQKKSYVNWVINVLSETPEYSQVKNRLAFIDGMEYKDNVLLSNADYHTTDFVLDNRIYNSIELAQFGEKISELIPRDPGRTTSIRSEFIRSTTLNDPELRLADVISVSLNMMGEDIETTLLDLDFNSNFSGNSFANCYGQIGKSISGMSPYMLNSNISQQNVVAFAFGEKDERTIILANLSDSSASCQIFNLELNNFQQSIFDGKGALLEQSMLKTGKKVFSILPGGVVVLEGSVN